MIRVEFHCHTIHSSDGLMTPRELVATCAKKGIERVIVTDHNKIAGALQAQEIDPERVIVGEEIMTTQGELLVAFVKEEIPARLSPLETIERLRAQGAFISVSHPFDWRRSGAWQTEDLLAILPLVDAIETFNSRCVEDGPNQMAAAFAKDHQLLGTAGSDAHFQWELGRANLIVPEFDSPEELKQALSHAVPVTKRSPGWVHIMSTYAKIKKAWQNNKKPENEIP